MWSSFYMWYKETEHFPFGMREVRPLLVARGMAGFFGVFGMYCKFYTLIPESMCGYSNLLKLFRRRATLDGTCYHDSVA